jgi:hypothetical protein
MQNVRLIVITGLPGTGKSTLARRLATHYRLPMIAKDTIKESMMDVLVGDETRSRALSDASFAVVFAIAKDLLAAGVTLILEGNFGAGEHETGLLDALAGTTGRIAAPDAAATSGLAAATALAAPPARTLHSVRVAQVLCRTEESVRRARMNARGNGPIRHPGHRDGAQLHRVPACDAFLELPGERLLFDGGLESTDAIAGLTVSLDRALSLG